MRNPAIAMTSNLMWTDNGTVWATWRLQPAGVDGRPVLFPYAPAEEQRTVIAHHQALYQALRGEAMLLGLCADLDPGEFVGRMLDGVDIATSPEWAEEVELTLDKLQQIPIGTRTFWLAVPLKAGTPRAHLEAHVAAQEAKLRGWLGLPRWRPSPEAVLQASRAALAVEKRIPGAFRAVRAGAAEQTWIALHLQRRGLAMDASVPLPDPGRGDVGSVLRSPVQIPDALVDEGGQSDVGKRERFFPFGRRFVKVQSSWSSAPSYQVLQVLAATPKAGFVSPGTEWMSFVDQMPFDVDWVQRIQVTAAEDVRRRNKRAESNLQDQVLQQESVNAITGPAADLTEVALTLAAYQEALNRSEREVEVEGTVVFATGAADADTAQSRARMLADEYKRAEFILDAPLGSQAALWWSFLPGTVWDRRAREFSQITTGADFATGVPMVGADLGDPKGARFGVNISVGRASLIFSDKDGSITGNTSASYGVVGELGSGKSVLMKCDMGETMDRGGRAIALDRTTKREYASFARSLRPDDTVIADVMDPQYSLDPLRMFGPLVGARMVQSLFTTLLGISPRDPLGSLLSELLDPADVASRRIVSLSDLRRYLEENPEGELKSLLRLMKTVASKDLGRVLFDDSLPPVDTSKRAIVFLTAGLSVPDYDELNSPQLYHDMTLEKIVGRSMYAMLMGITRQLCFADDRVLAGAYIDEIHNVTQSPEGLKDFKEHVSDGRKHRTFVAAGSQDPSGFGTDVTRGLLRTRYVMRQTDENLAHGCAKWLTGRRNDEDVDMELVKAITQLSPVGADNRVMEGREGEGFMRDQLGRIGKFQRLLPERADRRQAVLSTPPVNVMELA